MSKSNQEVKILFFSDTHLGIDYPIKPKIKRRRGDDFFNNYRIILERVYGGEADIVVHGGDMFYRAKVHPTVVSKSFEPLIEIAEREVPVVIVPGNHERSFLPVSLFDTHENILVFDQPKIFNFNLKAMSISISGFPCARKGIRDKFINLVDQTRINESQSDFNFLLMHQSVEGATVGVQNYTFRFGDDIFRGKDIPNIDAVLSGHIHRAQILKVDLEGKELNCPVIYPGSIERTSTAEREERKGYFMMKLQKVKNGNKKIDYEFCKLPARPMVDIVIDSDKFSIEQLKLELKTRISKIDPDAVVRIKPIGNYDREKYKLFSVPFLRSISPDTMNVDVSIPREAFTKKN